MESTQPSFSGLRVAALESRRSEDMQRLIQRFGGKAYVSPSMREVPIEGNREAVDFAYRVITGQINIVLFLTGVGFRHLLAAIEKHVDRKRFLNALSDITTVVRGPKPLAALREEGLTATYRVPEPNTWRELLTLLDQSVPLANQVVGLQEYGVPNRSLIAGLEARGARVHSVRVYQWELPEDSRPLQENLQAILHGERDVLLLTSAHQIVNLMRLAAGSGVEEELRKSLLQMVVASIGPTTSEMIQHLDLSIDLEPEHSKMGHLVQDAAEKCHRILQAKRFMGGDVRAKVHSPSPNDPSTSPAEVPAATPSTNATHKPAWESSPFLRACRRQPTEVTPVWLMRQAGRYMAEYRQVRERVGFLELCKNPALCAEVMVTAVQKLGVDAAIIFSDLLPILEPMGLLLEFSKGDGPVIHNPLRSSQDVDRVRSLESMESLSFVMETVRLTRAAIPETIPVIGFSGAPFTLASYMIEGGSSRNFASTKQWMYQDEGAWRALMERLVPTISLYLNSQIAAGAQCVQLFDSWVGCLGPSDYRQYVLPYMTQILESIVPNVPVINFATGNPQLVPMLRGDRRTVVGLDWRIGLDTGWGMVGTDRSVQGNLDPLVLLGSPTVMRNQVRRVLEEADARPGHIFNLGHGVLPQTDVAQAQALVEMVHEWSRR